MLLQIKYSIIEHPIYILEIVTAVLSTFFTWQEKRWSLARILSYFMWITVFVETIGIYTYFLDLEALKFIKETKFRRNFWWYNSFYIVSYSFYTFWIIKNIKNILYKKILNFSILIYVISAIVNFLILDIYFKGISLYMDGSGMLLFLIATLLFNKYDLATYVILGSIFFNAMTFPLTIFTDQYSLSINPIFVETHRVIIALANYFLYITFIIGFYINFKQFKKEK